MTNKTRRSPGFCFAGFAVQNQRRDEVRCAKKRCRSKKFCASTLCAETNFGTSCGESTWGILRNFAQIALCARDFRLDRKKIFRRWNAALPRQFRARRCDVRQKKCLRCVCIHAHVAQHAHRAIIAQKARSPRCSPHKYWVRARERATAPLAGCVPAS